jgi:hypothetical protein
MSHPLGFLPAFNREDSMFPQADLWVPATKKELVRSLSTVYLGQEDKFARMPKRQLMAIFYYLRRRHGMFS